MKPDFSIVATWYNGRPLEELNKLIKKRAVWLDGSDAALFSAAHTVLRSLKPLVKIAKVTAKALRNAYTITDTGLVMGRQRHPNGGWKYRPHHPGQADYNPEIRPICLWGGGIPEHRVHVYRVAPRFKARMKFEKNLNKGGCWYIAAYNEATARRYAEETLMRRAVERYVGLARASVAAMRRALAQTSADNPPTDDANFKHEVLATAEGLAHVQYQKAGKHSSVDVGSDLSYGRLSLQNPAGLEYAIAKAANSIAGYMRHAAERNFLIPTVETPFPEIARNGSYRR